MPFGRLSPVSETDSESLHTNATTTSSELRPKPLNFSRPRPLDVPSSRNIHRDTESYNSSSSASTTPSVRAISAFYDPPQQHDLPDEPRFSTDSDRTGASADNTTPGEEFAWDFQAGELRSRRRTSDIRAQRSSYPNGNGVYSRSNSYVGSHSTASGSDQPLIAELPGSSPPLNTQSQKLATALPQNTSQIVKHISVDQRSERMSICSATTGETSPGSSYRNGSRAGWEDGASHHTMSVNGETREGIDSSGLWKSSDYDVSQLSEKKLAKLKKKGINPQLYMEMKAARGGKGKLVGPLVGNTYIG